MDLQLLWVLCELKPHKAGLSRTSVGVFGQHLAEHFVEPNIFVVNPVRVRSTAFVEI